MPSDAALLASVSQLAPFRDEILRSDPPEHRRELQHGFLVLPSRDAHPHNPAVDKPSIDEKLSAEVGAHIWVVVLDAFKSNVLLGYVFIYVWGV